MPLNDAVCKNAKPEAKPRKLADSGGLFLKVMPTGAKYWQWKYRLHGKEKLLSFGVYPEVTLGEAREKRDAARKLLAGGADPSIEKKHAQSLAKLNAENTFEALAREWYDIQKTRWVPRHAAYVLKRLQADVFPEIGAHPIKEISPPQLLAALRKIEQRGAYEIAHRALQVCGQVFRYAIVTGRDERDISADLKGALKPIKHGHFAAIDAKALPAFLEALSRNDARLYPRTIAAIKLLMLTFVRTSELINARWEELDLERGEWIIPAERMKMRQVHVVPLARQVVTILNELHAHTGQWGHVFPNQVEPRKSMSNNTVLKALERLGYKGEMTGHGFRALAMSTIKEKLGYRHEVVDRQLAHAPRDKIAAAYDRAQFLDERRKMMQEWADYLDEAVGQYNVVEGNFRWAA